MRTNLVLREQPIRVVQVMGKMMGGGVESTVMNHVSHLDHRRIVCDLLVEEGSTRVPIELIERMGGHVHVVPARHNPAAFMRASRQVFERTRPDIVHSHINTLSVFPLHAARDVGIPIRIAHSHSTSNPREPLRHLAKLALRPWAAAYANAYAACSERAGRWLFGDKLVDAGKLAIVSNAIDVGRFHFNGESRTRVRRTLGISDTTMLIGQVGRLCTQKNPMFTMRAVKRFADAGGDVALLYAGDGPLTSMLRKEAKSLGVRTILLGQVDDVSALYSALDLLALPSLYEGLSMTAVEAQANGLPILASEDVPSETDLGLGLVRFLRRSPDSWSRAIAAMSVRHPERRMTDLADSFRKAGYEIGASSAALEHWYRRLTVEMTNDGDLR